MAVDYAAQVMVNYGYDGVTAGPTAANLTQEPWMIKHFNAANLIPGFVAGENLGHDAIARRWPNRPMDKSGFPVFLDSGTGKLKEMTLTDYEKYFGVLMAPADADSAAQVLKLGAILEMPVGSKAVTAGDLVMCETDGAGVAFDVIPQKYFDGDANRWFTCPTDTIPTVTETTFFGGPLASIKEGTLYDLTAKTNVDLVFVDVTPTDVGEIQLMSATTFKLYEQLEDGDILQFNGSWKPSPTEYSIGRALKGGATRTSATVFEYADVLLLDG